MSQFIEAVLFAEFDIDKGSVLRQQYPEKVSDDEGLLAELMLPEGAHNHFQDWTVFMLNRPAGAAADAAPEAPRWPVQAYEYDADASFKVNRNRVHCRIWKHKYNKMYSPLDDKKADAKAKAKARAAASKYASEIMPIWLHQFKGVGKPID